MINLSFPRPKDPRDNAWYVLRAPEPVLSVLSVTTSVSDPPFASFEGNYSTSGDAVTGSDLVASDYEVPTSDVTTSDGKTVPAGLAIVFKLAGGVPHTSYAVTAGIQTVSGSTLYRSVILEVTGL